jgi:hypothetical protein
LFRKRWEFGQARIVARQRHKWTPGAVNKYATKYDYVADVVPDSGLAPFRATFTSTFGSDEIFMAPSIGSQTRVRFKAGGEDVQLDGKFLVSQERARKDAERKQFGAAGAQVTTTTRPANVQQMRDHLQQMRDRLEDLDGENPGSVIRFRARVSGAGGSDSVERLERLTDLHDRGVLTDAEFAAEKAKILGET